MAQGQTIVVGTCAAALVLGAHQISLDMYLVLIAALFNAGNLAGSPPLMWALFTRRALVSLLTSDVSVV